MDITVKFGAYNVVENKANDGITLYKGDRKICDISNVHWWDKDAIERLMYANEERILSAEKALHDNLVAKVSKEFEEELSTARSENEQLKLRIAELEQATNKTEVNTSNVLDVLRSANEVLKNETADAKLRGFLCSRISQVTNKLAEAYA